MSLMHGPPRSSQSTSPPSPGLLRGVLGALGDAVGDASLRDAMATPCSAHDDAVLGSAYRVAVHQPGRTPHDVKSGAEEDAESRTCLVSHTFSIALSYFFYFSLYYSGAGCRRGRPSSPRDGSNMFDAAVITPLRVTSRPSLFPRRIF